MQFITHRDPVNVPGSARAFGAAGDAISNLLQIYGGYKNQKREDAQRALENKFKQDEMNLRSEEFRRRIEAENLQNQLLARANREQDLARGVASRPDIQTGTRTENAAPDFNVDSMKPDAATPFGSPKIDTSLGRPTSVGLGGVAKPLIDMEQLKLKLSQPTTSVPVMGPAPVNQIKLPEIRDSRGNVIYRERTEPELTVEEIRQKGLRSATDTALAKGDSYRITPDMDWLPPALMGIAAANGGIVDKTTFERFSGGGGGATTDKIFDKATGTYYAKNPKSGEYDVVVGHVTPEREKVSASDRKAAKDESDAQMISDVRPGDPESIPVQYRALAIQRADGRGQVPRGSAYNIVDQLAAAYNGDSDVGNIKARQDLRKELIKGSPSARGGQVTRINQFAGHLNDLQEASDDINKHLANSDWQTINALDQKLTRSGKRGPLAAYKLWADTVINEYTTTLKGGMPTDQDKKDFATLHDTTTAPAVRQAIIDSMKLAIEERANAMESAWKGAFHGKSSVESGQPMFNENYRYDQDSGIWRHSRRGVMQGAASGPKRDPIGILDQGAILLGNPQAGNPMGIPRPKR